MFVKSLNQKRYRILLIQFKGDCNSVQAAPYSATASNSETVGLIANVLNLQRKCFNEFTPANISSR